MAAHRGIVSQIWSVASEPEFHLVAFIDDDLNALAYLGAGQLESAIEPPEDVSRRLTNAVTDVIDEAATSLSEVFRLLEVHSGGVSARISLRARMLPEEGAAPRRFMIHVDHTAPVTPVPDGPSMKLNESAPNQELILRQLSENIDSVFWVASAGAAEMLYVSHQSLQVLGIPAEDLRVQPSLWVAAIHPGDQARVIAALSGSGVEHVDEEYRLRHRDGSERWIHAKSFPIYDSKGALVRIAGLASDITARKNAELVLREQAHRDPLTEVLNRRGLGQALVDIRDRGQSGSAVLFDCDDFKVINDKFGHASGDVVLRQVASRLQRTLRPTDVLGRVGGDEFLVLLPGRTEVEAAEVAERLRVAVVQTHLRIGDATAQVSASFGVTAIDNHLVVDQIVHRAEEGVRASKKHGKNQVRGHAGESLSVKNADTIRASLLRGEGLRVVSQSIRSLASNEPVAMELLTRRDTTDPLHEPTDFFAFAIEHNVITSVDLACLRACLNFADTHHPSRDVHINIFPSTLLEMSKDAMARVFGHRSLEHCHVEIVEEQFIADPEHLLEAVRSLRSLGAHIVLDDVGFGQSSLETLVLLEPDGVKLDRRVISGVGESVEKQRNLRRLFQIVTSVGASAVAEGIEVQSDLDYVRSIGIPFGQGYYWDRPE